MGPLCVLRGSNARGWCVKARAYDPESPRASVLAVARVGDPVRDAPVNVRVAAAELPGGVQELRGLGRVVGAAPIHRARTPAWTDGRPQLGGDAGKRAHPADVRTSTCGGH